MRKYIASLLFILAFNSNAAIISVDWKTSGDNLVTRDTASGLDWLDLSETNNMSFADVSSELRIGRQFEGWRFATNNEVYDLWSKFGMTITHSTNTAIQGLSPELVEITSFIGNIFGPFEQTGYEYVYGAWGFTQEIYIPDPVLASVIGAYYEANSDKTYYQGNTAAVPTTEYQFIGSYLVQTSPVPVPATVWLFGSGLLGLIGLARSRKA